MITKWEAENHGLHHKWEASNRIISPEEDHRLFPDHYWRDTIRDINFEIKNATKRYVDIDIKVTGRKSSTFFFEREEEPFSTSSTSIKTFFLRETVCRAKWTGVSIVERHEDEAVKEAVKNRGHCYWLFRSGTYHNENDQVVSFLDSTIIWLSWVWTFTPLSLLLIWSYCMMWVMPIFQNKRREVSLFFTGTGGEQEVDLTLKEQA